MKAKSTIQLVITYLLNLMITNGSSNAFVILVEWFPLSVSNKRLAVENIYHNIFGFKKALVSEWKPCSNSRSNNRNMVT